MHILRSPTALSTKRTHELVLLCYYYCMDGNSAQLRDKYSYIPLLLLLLLLCPPVTAWLTHSVTLLHTNSRYMQNKFRYMCLNNLCCFISTFMFITPAPAWIHHLVRHESLADCWLRPSCPPPSSSSSSQLPLSWLYVVTPFQPNNKYRISWNVCLRHYWEFT